MKSVAFPNMFQGNSTRIVSDHEATATNLKLLLLSNKGCLCGDPYYGTDLRKLTFEQNGFLLKEVIVDSIYTAILQFMPQLLVKRKDITIVQRGVDVYINIKAMNMVSYQTDMYQIDLMNYEVK